MSSLKSRHKAESGNTGSYLWELDLVKANLWVDQDFSAFLRKELDVEMLDPAKLMEYLPFSEKVKIFRNYLKSQTRADVFEFQVHLYGISTQVKMRTLKNSQGEPERMFGSMSVLKDAAFLNKAVSQTRDAQLVLKLNIKDPSLSRICHCNEAFKKLSGYNRDEITGKSLAFLLAPKARQANLDKYFSQVKKGEYATLQTQLQQKGGDVIWVQLTDSPVYNSSGEIEYRITTCKEYQGDELLELENRFFYLLNNQLSKVLSLEARSHIVLEHLSKEFEFEYTELWMSNIDYSELYKTCTYSFNETIKDQMAGEFHTAVKGKGLPGEAWKKGNMLYIPALDSNNQFIRKRIAKKLKLRSGMAMPVYFEDKLQGVYLMFARRSVNKYKGFHELFKRISLRLGSELAKLKVETEMDSFFTTTPDILCILDKNGIIKKHNPACTEVTGKTDQEILNSRFTDFLSGDHHQQVSQKIDQACRIGKPVYWEAELSRPLKTDLIFGWTFYYNRIQKLIYISGKNLSAEKENERQLKRSNELSRMGLWELNMETQEVTWSKITREIHAVPDDFKPDVETALNFYKPSYRDNLRAKIDQNRLKQIPKWSFLAEIIDARGQGKWVNVTGESVFKDDKCLRIFGSIQDVTNEIKTKQELQLSNQRYKLVSETLQIGVWEVNFEKEQFPQLLWDDTMYRIFGLNQEKDIHPWKAWKKRVHPDDAKRVDFAVEELIHLKKSFNTTFRIVLDDGSIRHLKGRGEFVENLNSKARIIGVNYDVTKDEHRKAEILHLKRLKRAVINSTDDLIWAIDPNFNLILANSSYLQTMEKFTGNKYEIGRKVVSAAPGQWRNLSDKKDIWLKAYQKALTGEFSEILFKVNSGDGNKRYFQTYLYPIHAAENLEKDSRIIGVSCFSRDVTKRRKYIETIETQNERLKDIAWLQSHVVRAPLASIMGLLDLIQHYDLEPEEFDGALKRLDYSCKELDKVISDIAEKTEEEFHAETETFNDRR